MTAEPTPEPRTQIELIYVGRGVDTKGKLRHWWQKPDGTAAGWNSKAMNRGGVIGGIYTIDQLPSDDDGPTRVDTGTLAWTGRRIPDTDQIARWALDDKTHATEHAREAAERKAIRDHDPVAGMTVREIRAWLNSSPAHRSTRVAVVLKELGIR